MCPRYEGIDERIRSLVDLELSIGDYVVTGGELPALVVIDAVIRLLPGAIDDASTLEESFGHGLLEYPQYTRPPVFRGMDVPAILTSGDHGAVRSLASRPGRRADPPAAAGPPRATRTAPPARSRGRAILRRRRTRPRRSRISPPQPRLPR